MSGGSLHKILKKLRRDREMTLENLHELSGLAVSTISKIENGLQKPTQKTLEIYVDVFKLPDIGALYALPSDGQGPHSPPVQSHQGVSFDGRIDSVGTFEIDAETIKELEDVSSRLNRLVFRIENFGARRETRVASPAPPSKRRIGGKGRGRFAK
jgi:transcriptional regulator with XRE-family HTH domain